MPLEAAQIFFQQPGQASQIEVSIDDPDNARAVGRAITAGWTGQPIRIVDWQQNNNSFFAAVQVEQNVMFLILTLIILVAAFNVVSSLIMMVKDKTRDIAVLRTIGAGRGSVLRIFLMVGASVGVTGTIAGTLLGVVFCLNIERIQGAVEALTGRTVFDPTVYYLAHLPARGWTGARSPRSSPWRWCSRCWQRCTPAGAPPARTPWKPCAMSDPLALQGVTRTYQSGDGALPVLRGRRLDAARRRDRGSGGAVRHG